MLSRSWPFVEKCSSTPRSPARWLFPAHRRATMHACRNCPRWPRVKRVIAFLAAHIAWAARQLMRRRNAPGPGCHMINPAQGRRPAMYGLGRQAHGFRSCRPRSGPQQQSPARGFSRVARVQLALWVQRPRLSAAIASSARTFATGCASAVTAFTLSSQTGKRDTGAPWVARCPPHRWCAPVTFIDKGAWRKFRVQ